MDTLVNALTVFFNSSPGFAVVWSAAIAVLILLMHRFSPFQKLWEKYEGAIITAIKLAEKDIPGTLPDAGLQRLEQALKYVIAAIAQQRPGPFIPSQRLVNALKEGIQIKHAELERLGNLNPRKCPRPRKYPRSRNPRKAPNPPKARHLQDLDQHAEA